MVLHCPRDVGGEHNCADRDYHPGSSRAKKELSARISERDEGKTENQNHRPVFAEHRAGGGHPGQCRPADAARFEGAQEA